MRDGKDAVEFKIRVFEEVLKIVAKYKFPFLLKGSFLNSIYYEDPIQRLAKTEDLDFVYLNKIENPLGVKNNFRIFFKPYMETILKELDKLKLEFRGVPLKVELDENGKYSGMGDLVDYEMEDDFLTIGFEMASVINLEKNIWKNYDIEFTINLPLFFEPSSIIYHPINGSEFIIPYATPPEVQVAWKLHQCLVRIRAKDLVDLIYMLYGIDFTKEDSYELMLKTVVNECMLGDSEHLLFLFDNLLQGNCEILLQNIEIYEMSNFKVQAGEFKEFIPDRGDTVKALIYYFKQAIQKNLNYLKCKEIIKKITKSYNLENGVELDN